MDNKKIKKTRKPRKLKDKKKSSKNKKNIIKQNVKINISTSGGSGGGGTSVPNIPTPIQSFARSEKTGENVNVSNLLNRIGNQQAQQARAFDNFSNIINNSMQREQQQINRDDRIDAAEQINNGIDGDDEREIVIFPQFAFFDEQIPKFENIPIPIVTPTVDTSTQTLFERIPTQTIETQTEPEVQVLPEETGTGTTERLKNEPPIQGLDLGGGGGGPSAPPLPPAPEQDNADDGIFKNTLKNGTFTYTFKQKKVSIGTFADFNKALAERDKFKSTFPSGKVTKSDVQNYADGRRENKYN